MLVGSGFSLGVVGVLVMDGRRFLVFAAVGVLLGVVSAGWVVAAAAAVAALPRLLRVFEFEFEFDVRGVEMVELLFSEAVSRLCASSFGCFFILSLYYSVFEYIFLVY